MNTADLGKVLGNKTAASLVLNGKRELSKAHIRSLAARFKVEPRLFCDGIGLLIPLGNRLFQLVCKFEFDGRGPAIFKNAFRFKKILEIGT